MKNWKKRTKITVLVVFLLFLALFAALCWKKRRGIYNTYMKLTNQEIPYSVREKRKKKYGYYEQKLNVSMDMDNTVSIVENDESADAIETDIPKEETRVKTSYEIDQQLQAEQENGYSWEEPMVIQNPYQIAPLTAVVVFDTPEECGVHFTVKGKTEAADISGEVDAATSHRVPVIGLYPAEENTVVLELLDENGQVTDSQEIKIKTDSLPEKLADVIEPVKTSGESAYELTMVYGQKTVFPFAYDCMGDIRWYMNTKIKASGIFMLSDNRMIVQDTEAQVPSSDKPQTTNFYEMDYLGRAYTLYYVAGGIHHEVIEKEPGGNLLVLSSSLEGHIEDKIQELDRETGEVVNELVLGDIIKCKYEDRVDWAHLNTVSYQPESDTIIISPRNLESVIKLNWTTKEIQWMLCDPRFWAGTEYEQYVLQPEGDFNYHFQQHTAYQISADLDGNDETVEISMFDNHSVKVRSSNITYYDRTKESYLVVYSVNEKNGTVQQIKKIPTVWSTITSSTIYDEDSDHLFGMCGHVRGTEDGRKGMTYEFDYDTEEIQNQFSIKTTFYRASEMEIDYNDLASPMEPAENYIRGELLQPTKTWKWLWTKKPEQILDDEDVTLHLTGQVLYVGTYDHRISQIIFHGKENTYVYDTTNIRLHEEDYLEFYEHIPVPLQGLDADEYEIYVMYQDEFYDTAQKVTIK